MAGLIIADFNGNGRADIATATVTSFDSTLIWDWKVSYDGRGDWKPLHTFTVPLAAIGRFDATRGADILFWDHNSLDIASSGLVIPAPPNHSRQDMR
jgi:hypothetical protein